MSKNFADPQQREERIAALEQLAAFLREHPDVPLPKYTFELSFCVLGSDEDGIAAIEFAARMLGVEPKWSGERTQIEACRSFGPLRYRVHKTLAQEMADYHERNRLGREAFERLHAEAAVA